MWVRNSPNCFEDAGKTYLQIAERISDRCLSQQAFQD